jgi:hypothetical protein
MITHSGSASVREDVFLVWIRWSLRELWKWEEVARQKSPILTAGALYLFRIFKISENSLRRPLTDVAPPIGSIAPMSDMTITDNLVESWNGRLNRMQETPGLVRSHLAAEHLIIFDWEYPRSPETLGDVPAAYQMAGQTDGSVKNLNWAAGTTKGSASWRIVV